MSDKELELLKNAKNGDNIAIDNILSSYKHLVMSIARKYFLIGGDKEDLIQEGMIGLFKAITCFDESKNNNFTQYSAKLIEHEIINAIRRANSNNQQVLSESVFVEDDDILSGEELSPEGVFISNENTDELNHEIAEKLSKFERVVVDCYLKGYGYMDIAEILGKPSKSIDNALSRIKKKLEYLKERL